MGNNHRPHGYQSVTPYFTVNGAEEFIDFLKKVFEAEELQRGGDDINSIQHAEVKIGDTIVEISEANNDFLPRTNALHLFVSDVDACYKRALEAGCTLLYEVADMPYGERSGGVVDPHGNHWYIATFTGGEGQGYGGGQVRT
ncbi:MAG: VOC family protein [Anaerobacillus sp.]